MRAVIVVNHAAKHQTHYSQLIKSGLEKHGWGIDMIENRQPIPSRYDMAIAWSAKKANTWRFRENTDKPVLIMERAHLQPRMTYCSLGFNGICGRGLYAATEDGGERWRRVFAHHEKPWRDGGKFALVMGQVRGDYALLGVHFHSWVTRAVQALRAQGKLVMYRPHPQSVHLRDTWQPMGASRSDQSLERDLEQATEVVTYNSTSGVEAVLAGLPTVTYDPGAMAWPVTSHSVDDPVIRPDRSAWMHRMAFTSWHPDEIASGEAWGHLKGQFEAAHYQRKQSWQT